MGKSFQQLQQENAQNVANAQAVMSGKGTNAYDPHWMPPQGDATMPGAPDYSQAYDPKTMSLADYLAGKYDPSGLNAYKEQAMRKGPSAWATLAGQQNAEQVAHQREAGAGEVNAQTAKNMDELAAHGGLSSGAMERAGTEGAKNYLSMSQDLGRQGNTNTLQIGINDEQNRIQQLGQLPGMEMQQAGMYEDARNKDINNITQENERRNQYNQNMYTTQMGAWSGNKQAQAIENSGKK